MKRLILILTFLVSTIFFLDNVNAEDFTTFTYSFTDDVGYTNDLVNTITNNGTSIVDHSLYMNGSSYINYTLNTASYLDIRFDFKKSNTDSYSRLLYLGGLNREIEVKGSSTNMYINGDLTTTWAQNEWNSMRILLKNNYISYYVNDVLIKTEICASSITFIQFGMGKDSSNYFTGYIDNLILSYSTENPELGNFNLITNNNSYVVGLEEFDNQFTTNSDIFYLKATDYSSSSMSTIKNNINNNSYSQLSEYNYYLIYNSGGKNGHRLVFFNNLDDLYFYEDSESSIGLYCNNCYIYTYSSSSQTDVGLQNNYGIAYGMGQVFIVNDGVVSGNNQNIYLSREDIYNYLTNVSSSPTISITEESESSVTILDKEYITDITLNIEFSLIDNDKYLYMYKYGSDSNWTTLTLTQSNNISKTFSTNDTLYVQILDVNTNELVTSSTYTISKINYDLTPYITIEEITDNSCILDNYIICQSLRINSHIADFNKYKFIIIDHTQNITDEFKEMTIYKTYYMNSDIEVRIVDKSTGEYTDIKSFTITTISESTENLGQHITSECDFASIGNNYLCNYYFYNYNPDLYDYYYGTSTTNFEKLYSQTETTGYPQKYIFKLKEGLGKLQEIAYSKNTTVYFKVIDKETSEIIYTKTFTISYDLKLEEADKTSIFDIFKNFKNDNSSIKNLLEDIWTKITTSSIYEYILILVVGTLIIIIINAANR